MTYYRVLPRFDNFRLTKGLSDKGILIANELWTERELEKNGIFECRGVSEKMFEKVEIPKSRVCWFFGARFESEVS